jgi:ArsR family transcriptional regulator
MTELPVIRERGTCCELPVSVDPEWAAARADLLKALADPTRLSMAATLRQARAPVCVCDFTAAYGLTQSTISHHMARLRDAGLVESEKEGIWVYYRLAPDLSPESLRLLDALIS